LEFSISCVPSLPHCPAFRFAFLSQLFTGLDSPHLTVSNGLEGSRKGLMKMAAVKAMWRDGDGKVHCEDRAAIRRVEAVGRWRERNAEELAGLAWYALVIRGGREAEVEAILERRGFCAVVPSWREERRVHRRAKAKREVRVPIARGYVLVGFEAAQMGAGLPPWHAVFDISMIAGVVGLDDSGRAWRLQGKQVAAFLLKNDGEKARVVVPHKLAVKDVVRVVYGPFAGWAGPIIKVSAKDLSVMLTIFGKETELPVDYQSVQLVGQHATA